MTKIKALKARRGYNNKFQAFNQKKRLKAT
jgi:hypothetical protein